MCRPGPGSDARTDAGFFPVRGEVPGQLREPRAVWIPGHAQQVNPAGPVPDHERRVQPGQAEPAVHMEHADRPHGPGAGEGAPPVRVQTVARCVRGAGPGGPCPRRSGVPGRRSSPWIRATPQARFCVASRRSTRRVRRRAVAVPVTGAGSTSWSPCGGASTATFQGSRPGARASPSPAPRDNAASMARSVHSSRGLGFTRRSTATSWPRTRISVSFDADDRASSASQDSTATPNR